MKKSIVDFEDAELGRHVKQRHNHLATLHAAGLHHTHPSEQWNADSKVLRDNRDSLPENVASSKPIELEGGPAAEQALDDPAPTPFTPRVERPGMMTVDSAVLEELAIRRSGSSNPEEDIRQARLRRNGSSSASVRAMAESIPGYTRLK